MFRDAGQCWAVLWSLLACWIGLVRWCYSWACVGTFVLRWYWSACPCFITWFLFLFFFKNMHVIYMYEISLPFVLRWHNIGISLSCFLRKRQGFPVRFVLWSHRTSFCLWSFPCLVPDDGAGITLALYQVMVQESLLLCTRWWCRNHSYLLFVSDTGVSLTLWLW